LTKRLRKILEYCRESIARNRDALKGVAKISGHVINIRCLVDLAASGRKVAEAELLM
jgi:hypothetical protein